MSNGNCLVTKTLFDMHMMSRRQRVLPLYAFTGFLGFHFGDTRSRPVCVAHGTHSVDLLTWDVREPHVRVTNTTGGWRDDARRPARCHAV